MNNELQLHASPARPTRPRRAAGWLRPLVLAATLASSGSGQAVDFGPFTLTGFTKAELVNVGRSCADCQVAEGAAKDFQWADQVAAGKSFGDRLTHVVLFQPFLAANFDLGRGFKLTGLISQRWRDGKEDFKGFLYENNVYVSHEDFGSIRVGATTTRGWSVADYPYGSNIGLADPWGSSGAGYGILTRSIRVTTRPLDVYDGELVLEATQDFGKSGWERNKPRFFELYAQFHKGDLVLDAVYQQGRNGTPSAFGHGVFTGLTPFPADDGKLGGSSQSIAMVMGRYQIDANLEISGGLRANRWSGAYAVVTTPPNTNTGTGLIDEARWNNMFNVDWTRDLGGGVYKGYPATSTDLMLGLRYRDGPWTVSTGYMHMGAAATENPDDRGQSNSASINTLGLNYNFRNGLEVYTSVGLVQYAHVGLAPLTMPSHSAFTNVDSRVRKHGSWITLGAVYVF
jgi:hypothetical protein